MTTRTISEMITITNNTRTAAATVSSERRAGREIERPGGEFAWTRRGQEGSVPVSGPEISLLVEKLEGCLDQFSNG